MAQQLAAGRVTQLFGRDPSHPLNEPADDLPPIQSGIDWHAGVHQQIDARDFHLAGEAIDEYLAAGCAVGVIEEGMTLARFTVEVHARRGIKTALAHADTFEVRTADDLLERHPMRRIAIVEHKPV